MKKQSIAIIGVIAFVLAVVVGYALFSDNLTVSGSATATGDFDVEFTSVGEITKVGYTAVDATEIAKISEDKNTLTELQGLTVPASTASGLSVTSLKTSTGFPK